MDRSIDSQPCMIKMNWSRRLLCVLAAIMVLQSSSAKPRESKRNKKDDYVLQCDVKPKNKTGMERAMRDMPKVQLELPQSAQGDYQHMQKMMVKHQEKLIEQQKTLNLQQVRLEARQKSIDRKQSELVHMLDRMYSLDVCQTCFQNEYCATDVEPPICLPCTICPPGFMATTICSRTKDVQCMDVNECEMNNAPCNAPGNCINTAGGYFCIKEVGSCGSGYYHNVLNMQCEPCSRCMEASHVLKPCTTFEDAVCSPSLIKHATDFWRGHVKTNMVEARTTRSPVTMDPSRLPIDEITIPTDTFFAAGDGDRIIFKRDGMIWVDYNMAIKHTCPTYLQISAKVQDKLVGSTRFEATKRDIYSAASLSGAALVEAGQEMVLALSSAYCPSSVSYFGRPDIPDDPAPKLTEIANLELAGPLSILYASYDAGAVVWRARTRQNTNAGKYRVEYEQPRLSSDGYVISLPRLDSVLFQDEGIVKFSLAQATFSAGEPCRTKGYTINVKLMKNSGLLRTVSRQFKRGQPHTDILLRASGAMLVNQGDSLIFDIETDPQCQTRYGDNTPVSALNIMWLPTDYACLMLAELQRGVRWSGAGTRILQFGEVLNTDSDAIKAFSSGFLLFKKEGRVSLTYSQKLVHSCDYLKVTVFYIAGIPQKHTPVMQTVIGNTQAAYEGLQLVGTFNVQKNARVYLQLTCRKGRLDDLVTGSFGALTVVLSDP
ncbi:Hypp8634 [Branchiostoma lanceolatum]|uniref:Hypp8634 protein n=1 Tax=Branchiostoma lanceolatum TaxID=7740 RepID=A0A8J9Z9L7_BRALA|nr:Hypp8634 [Branchiostoma lanceolatum]